MCAESCETQEPAVKQRPLYVYSYINMKRIAVGHTHACHTESVCRKKPKSRINDRNRHEIYIYKNSIQYSHYNLYARMKHLMMNIIVELMCIFYICIYFWNERKCDKLCTLMLFFYLAFWPNRCGDLHHFGEIQRIQI